jgi:5-methylcytosine-specific restriction protein B
MQQRQYWWVSQGDTLDESLKDSYVWAPQKNKLGRAHFHWTNVARVKKGDVLFHYADGAIRAVSVAQSDGRESRSTLREGNSNHAGWRADVDVYKLEAPLDIKAIGPTLAALTVERGPVDRAGKANKGYLFELPPDAVESIAERMNLSGLPDELATVLADWKVSGDGDDKDVARTLRAFAQHLADAQLTLPGDVPLRLMASLLAKRFVILTGLSGSGKTRLAEAFARWITHSREDWALVAVGSDWTSNEAVVGYADQLNGTYVRTPTLDLILRAASNAHSGEVCVLVLDEMNLSHVERYFADVLSAMETSDGRVHLHSGDATALGVPQTIALPGNLFIIGTVNVDETTYLFSPKVLDRANVIEFRATAQQMAAFLDRASAHVELLGLDGMGARGGHARAFAHAAHNDPPALDEADSARLKDELLLLFNALAHSGNEFGFRVAHEITAFVAHYKQLTRPAQPDAADWFDQALDAQIMQKLLPRLNGGRAKLAQALWALALLCRQDRPTLEDALAQAREERGDDPAAAIENGAPMRYPMSAAKLARMWRSLEQNGFVSFMEA